MKQTKQILLAFGIPFFLTVALAFLGDYVFPAVCTSSAVIEGREICFEYHDESLLETGYGLLILGLFILALVLPSFVTMRAYQNRRNKLESTLNIQ